ncbi:hypothetical protein AGMMS49960_20220 [Betaproteobacteria bacterium]|nr:hypothetical protein AGMMS49543_16410 [Betaproteobacteria bacterium]GHU04483.1 hypothetical protein AGMMS49960_20220 [Betaproteobacteria bacterium]GHU24235.1 hypothetical protein AGMMS50243_27050 [Betaproteobacteria bacterium]
MIRQMLVAVLLLVPLLAGAQNIKPYATQGNHYRASGNGYYTGYNASTRSTWSANTQGSRTTGRDRKGNFYTYDAKTRTYQNYGTGERRSPGNSTGKRRR